MVEIQTNWDQVKQQMLNETSKVLRDFNKNVINDFENRLREKGIDGSKISRSFDRISFITDDLQEYQTGKVYFDEVYNEVSNDKWLESIR